jgi:hypothetical protein
MASLGAKLDDLTVIHFYEAYESWELAGEVASKSPYLQNARERVFPPHPDMEPR